MTQPFRSIMRRAVAALGLIAGLWAAAPAHAVNTRSQSDETESDFQKGELKSTSLSSDGYVTIAPALEKLFETGEAMVWDVAVAPNGDCYVATGHEGKVFRYDAQATTATLFCDLREVEATALALSPRGELYVGASPGGVVYRVRTQDRPTTFFVTHETYVWDLALSRSGVLYAATGTKGKIYSIERSGKGKVLFDSKADNVLSLCKQGDLPLLASTQNPALVLEIAEDGTAKALLDGEDYDEARSVIRGRKGAVYAALNGQRPSADRARILSLAALAAGAAPPSGEPSKPPSGEPAPKLPSRAIPSQIVKINPNGFVQTVWFSPESPIYSLHYDAKSGRLFAGVGEKGALFEVRENGEFTRVLQIEQRSIMAMASNAEKLCLGAVESGVVYSLSRAEGLQGIYLSRAIDAGDPAQWGALRVRASTPEGTSLTMATRMGNTAQPDEETWTPWSAEQSPKDGYVKIEGAPTRFLQYRATLKREEAKSPSPSLDTVEVFHLAPNLAPVIKQLKVGVTGAPGAGTAPAAAPKPPSGASTPSEARLAPTPLPLSGTPQPKSVEREPNSNSQTVQISWTVEEPNDDEVQAELYFKGEEETVWRKINKEPIRGTTSHRFPTATIPDGAYRVRLVVRDSPSNPPDLALESQMVSDHFIVDNTPPEILDLQVKLTKDGKYRLTARALDKATMIASARYNIDAGEWRLVFPEDRLFDSPDERFAFFLPFKGPGEHTVALMVVDREGNTTVAKQVVRVEEK